MIGLTFLVTELSEVQAVIKSVAALGWMAIGFLVFGAYKISKKALVSRITVWLFLVSFTLSLFIRSFYIFPVLLVGSGLIHTLFKPSASKDRLVIKWNVPLLIGILSLVGWGLIHPYLGAVPLIQLSSLFTGFGSLVLGGGNVVSPYMYETLVEGYGWISSEDFLAGLGLIQGMPGPMFSFSAWVAGLSFQENPFIQVSAGLTGALFLFLPGTLFIFLVAPVWNQVRLSPQIKPALKGVLAAAAGLVVSTALLILFATEIDFTSGLLIGVTLVLLGLKKIPVPLLVVIILGLGILL
jgi:chromate transporter